MSGNGKAPVDPLDIFIKLLGMTGSDNPHERAAFAHKANQYLKETLKSDWESFVRGKIKIEADPFVSAPVVTPAATVTTPSYRHAAPQPSAPPPPPKQYTDAAEIDKWITDLTFKNLPSWTQRRVNAIEANWRKNGYLLQGDYTELRTLSKSRRFK